jgi:hypothetical protein
MGARSKGSEEQTVGKDAGFHDPMAVTWAKKYSKTLDNIWARLPDWVGSIIVTLAVFIFGATIRGMFVSLHATKRNAMCRSSRGREYIVAESGDQLHNTE